MGFLTVYFNDFLLRIEWNLNLFSRTEMQVHINSIFQVASWCHSPWPAEEPWIWPWICRVPKDTLWGNVHFLSLRFSPLRCELFISMEMWIVNMLISLQHQHIPKRTIQQCTCFQVSWGSLMCLPLFCTAPFLNCTCLWDKTTAWNGEQIDSDLEDRCSSPGLMFF